MDKIRGGRDASLIGVKTLLRLVIEFLSIMVC